jgi:hypothetical protein
VTIRTIIVDDEPPAREGIRLRLHGEEDFEVVGEYDSARKAIAAIKKDVPDLLFLDIHMPGMTGIEMLHEIGPDSFSSPLSRNMRWMRSRSVSSTTYSSPSTVTVSDWLSIVHGLASRGFRRSDSAARSEPSWKPRNPAANLPLDPTREPRRAQPNISPVSWSLMAAASGR